MMVKLVIVTPESNSCNRDGVQCVTIIIIIVRVIVVVNSKQ